MNWWPLMITVICGLLIGWKSFWSSAKLYAAIASTMTSGAIVHAISRPVWPWTCGGT